jgi:hypothetical protein
LLEIGELCQCFTISAGKDSCPSGSYKTHRQSLIQDVITSKMPRCHGVGDRRIFMRPVEPRARQQPHGAAVEARMRMR